MQITCRSKIQFNRVEMYNERATGDLLAKTLESFVVSPSLRVQTVPDWIGHTSELNIYIKAGIIVIIGERPTPIKRPDNEPKKAIKAKRSNATNLTTQLAQPTEEELVLLNTPIRELIGDTSQPVSYPNLKGWPAEGKI
jgi:hypothetical protein